MKAQVSAVAGKRLLILDGTRIGCEIVRHAQALGAVAIVADYNTPENAPAKQIADEHMLVSIIDVDAVVDVIRRERIDGVVAGFSDKMLPYYAEICRRAGLPCYGSPELFRLFTDKAAYKKVCQSYGIPVIEGYKVGQFRDDGAGDVRFPVIVKPVNGSGSRGISICRTPSDVIAAADAAEASGVGVLVEQYLSGPEATVFWIFQDGQYHVSMMANRHVAKPTADSPAIPVAYTAPSSLLPDYLADVAPHIAEMLVAVGMCDGMMFMQGIVDDGIFRVYDIGYRVTGSLEYRLIEAVSGFNPINMLIHFALTGSMGEPGLVQKIEPTRNAYSFNVSISMRPGKVGRIEGIEETRRMPGIISVIQTRDVGEELPAEAIGQLRQITVRVLGVAESIEGVEKAISVISDTIRVFGVDGDDLTLYMSSLGSLEDVLL